MERTIVGIERPKVRNGCSIRTLNTLTYIMESTKNSGVSGGYS